MSVPSILVCLPPLDVVPPDEVPPELVPPDELPPEEDPPDDVPPLLPPAPLKYPYMKSGCSSHTNSYWPPAWKVTVHVGVAWSPMPVDCSTPGPVRWKLCCVVSSITFTVYVPGGIVGGTRDWLPTGEPSS